MFFYFHRNPRNIEEDFQNIQKEYYSSNVYRLLHVLKAKWNNKKESSATHYHTYGETSWFYSKKNKKASPMQDNSENHAGMEKRKIPSIVPYYATGLSCIIYAILAPIYRWGDFAAAACVTIASFCIFKKICKPHEVWVPIQKQKTESEKKGAVYTENSEIDRIIKEGTDALKRLHKANEQIENTEILQEINRMEDISFHIFAYVCDHPQKANQIRRFLNYYLPTTLKLLESYGYLAKQDVNGDNISSSMHSIEDIIKTIVKAFEKQLDSLFSDEAFDISADISVMESMLQQEGIFVKKDKEKESL